MGGSTLLGGLGPCAGMAMSGPRFALSFSLCPVPSQSSTLKVTPLPRTLMLGSPLRCFRQAIRLATP
eukprot:5930457-Alexandrium_andersonii.AAC.1